MEVGQQQLYSGQEQLRLKRPESYSRLSADYVQHHIMTVWKTRHLAEIRQIQNPESYTIEDSSEIVNPRGRDMNLSDGPSSTSPDMNMNYSIDKMFGDIELTANWMKNCTVSLTETAQLFRLTYSLMCIHIGDSVKIPLQETTRTGFAFCGWSVNAASTIVDYYPDQELQADDDTTLYAIWALEYYNTRLCRCRRSVRA